MAIKNHLEGLIADYDKLVKENAALRQEILALRGTISQASIDDADDQPHMVEIEQRVLQTLERQISTVPMAGLASDGAVANKNQHIRTSHSDSRILDIVRDGLMQGRIDCSSAHRQAARRRAMNAIRDPGG
jgi:hypothetical protein